MPSVQSPLLVEPPLCRGGWGRWLGAISLTVTFALAACGGGGGGGSSSAPPPPTPVAQPLKVVTTPFTPLPDSANTSVDPRKRDYAFGFSAPLAGLPTDKVQLTDGSGASLPVTLSYTGAVATVTSPTPLKPRTSYRVTFKAGLASDNGGTLAADYVFNFRTAFAVFDDKLLAPMQPTLFGNTTRLRLADVNGDGRLDAVVLTDINTTKQTDQTIQGYTLTIYLQNAAGTFDVAQQFDVVTGHYQFGLITSDNLFVMDIDGDGRPELLAPEYNPTNQDQSGIRVFKAGADGQYAFSRFILTPFVQGMEALDLDGDGRLDLVGAGTDIYPSALPDGFQVLRNTGTPAGLVARAPVALPHGTYWFGSGDFDKDGKPELLVNLAINVTPSSPAFAGVIFFSQTTPADFVLNTKLTQDATSVCSLPDPFSYFTCGKFLVADLNGDGLPDIVTEGGQLFYKVAAGGWVQGTGLFGKAFGTSDFDRDGVQDVLIAFETNAIYIAVAAGTRGSTSPELSSAFAVLHVNSPRASNYAIGDINGDGRPDVVIYETYIGLIGKLQAAL